MGYKFKALYAGTLLHWLLVNGTVRYTLQKKYDSGPRAEPKLLLAKKAVYNNEI
jgi:hypothetical protein